MAKITKQQIMDMTPMEIQQYSDSHPEDTLKMAIVLGWLCIKFRFLSLVKRVISK